MKKYKRFDDEYIKNKIAEVQKCMRDEGLDQNPALKKLGIPLTTFYGWKRKKSEFFKDSPQVIIHDTSQAKRPYNKKPVKEIAAPAAGKCAVIVTDISNLKAILLGLT